VSYETDVFDEAAHRATHWNEEADDLYRSVTELPYGPGRLAWEYRNMAARLNGTGLAQYIGEIVSEAAAMLEGVRDKLDEAADAVRIAPRAAGPSGPADTPAERQRQKLLDAGVSPRTVELAGWTAQRGGDRDKMAGRHGA
jgi:hypothetical protein